MRKTRLTFLAAAGLALALAACAKPQRDAAAEHAKAAGDNLAQATDNVINDPNAKEAGHELVAAAKDGAQAVAVGADQAADKVKGATENAKDKVDEKTN